MRMVRWLILSAVTLAGAVHAQGTVSSSGTTPGTAATQGSLQLRSSTGLRVRNVPQDDAASYLQADQIQGDPDSNLTLSGAAEVRRIDGVVKGERIDYRSDTGQTDLQGNVRMMRDGTLITGPSAQYNIDTDSGEIESPNFWIGASGGSARADRAEIFSRSQLRLTQVRYTGCPCPEPSWYIDADRVDLDFDENEGVARNGVLYFKGVPLLASPYLTFPVKKERKSGFLIPTYGVSSKSGLDLSVPYYFNLAPNYDATLQPRYLSKRGMQLGGEFRYLGESYSGSLLGTYLGDDWETGEKRWLFRSRHQQTLGGGFYADWDYARVSDDNYFRDFSSMGLNDASTTYLPQRGLVGWGNKYWQATAQVYKYQTLQDPDAPVTPPYNKMPELTLKGARYDLNNLELEWTSSAVRFQRPVYKGDRVGQDGDRLQSYLTAAMPIRRAGWYVVPKVGFHYTQYNTDWYDVQNRSRDMSRALPIMSVDAGMVFERDTKLFGNDSIQTLEPRLYYLRVPYRDQSKLPVYDTTLADFSFEQAFSENIYVGGWDRIANANQLTAALTTRWLDADTGFERISLSGGQRLYFEDQRVTLPDETPRKDRNVRSDFLVAASAALTDTLSTEVAAQYDPYDNNWSRGLVSARWRPQRLTSVALSYRYQRDPSPVGALYQPRGQNQISLAFQWPFTDRLYGVGRIDYSLRSVPQSTIADSTNESPRVTQAIAGLEYKGDCCWTGRVVFQRYAVSATESNSTVFFQLELSGLGSLGTNPMDLLNKSIPGYQAVSPQPAQGSKFERYE
ncbi:LPS-assembly protein LptD [Bordetella sp. 02P26C-1]|uniref:LPS-assembly protein LptD n=1 Tax=Bordetella sp. 02P26C-1 TaxID=2683195 RepID=UPI001353D263|nr:LPS assembly protein LptD [Bordetella sp. 02P26C-1]